MPRQSNLPVLASAATSLLADWVSVVNTDRPKLRQTPGAKTAEGAAVKVPGEPWEYGRDEHRTSGVRLLSRGRADPCGRKAGRTVMAGGSQIERIRGHRDGPACLVRYTCRIAL